MKISKSTRKSRRHRNTQANEGKEQKPFFSKSSDVPVQKKEDNSFFQPKLKIGEPNDKYEKEADSMADSVVNKSGNQPQIQSKEISSIQRYMTNAKEDELGTNTERMEKDKAIQEKPEIQRMEGEEEMPVQKMEEEEAVQQKEEEPVQKMEEEEAVQQKEEEPVQKMEEEEAVQQKEEEEPVQKMEEEEAVQEKEEEEAPVQTKPDSGGRTASPKVAQQLNVSKGRGSAMSDRTNAEMSNAFGYDFSGVKIHTDSDSEKMNKDLGAQAFTHGEDVYFNSGKYSPESKEGKRLLAHELTHVVQQNSSENQLKKKKKKSETTVRRQTEITDNPKLIDQANQIITKIKDCLKVADWKVIKNKISPKESKQGIEKAIERRKGNIPDLTGLGKVNSVDSFVNSIQVIQGIWSVLTPKERAKEFFKAANYELTDVGVPNFNHLELKRNLDALGYFTPHSWKFTLKKELVEGESLNDNDASSLASVTLHEARHAEQRFLAARFAAADKEKNIGDLKKELSIPRFIAKEAQEKKFDNGTDPSVKNLGEKMHESYVPNKVIHQAMTNDIGVAIKILYKKIGKAEMAVDALDFSVTEKKVAKAKKAYEELKSQIEAVKIHYTLYRNIAHEADAYEISNAVKVSFDESK